MVVLSKADLVNPSDRLQVVRYIESQLSAELGIPIPVFAVSVRGTDSSLAESWVKTELHPLLARNQELLAASLKRKIGGLRESVVHTLQHRIHRDQSVSTLELERWKQVEHEFLKVTGMIQAARRNTEVGVRSLLLSPGEILDQATDKLSAMEWKKEGTQHEYREMLGNVIRHTTGSPAIALLTKLKEVRDAASAALEKAALLLHVPAKDDSLPEIWGMPLFDHSSLVSHLIFEKPKFAFLGAAAVRKQIQSQLEPQIEPILANALRVYRKQLQEWAENYLSNLREDFEAKSAVYQARTGLAEEDPIPPDDKLKTSMEIDLKVLKDWSSAS